MLTWTVENEEEQQPHPIFVQIESIKDQVWKISHNPHHYLEGQKIVHSII